MRSPSGGAGRVSVAFAMPFSAYTSGNIASGVKPVAGISSWAK